MKKGYIVLFIACCFAGLGVVCFFWPKDGFSVGEARLTMPSIAEVLEIDTTTIEYVNNDEAHQRFDEMLETLDSQHIAIDTLSNISIKKSTKKHKNKKTSQQRESKQEIVHSGIVDTIDAIYTTTLNLDSLMRGSDTTQIRVVYYGDSQIEGDRMTMIIRRHLQERYGGGGVGLIPLHQTIGMRTLYQYLEMSGTKQSADGGPKRYLVYGPKAMRRANNLYGVMGQVAIMDDSLVCGSEEAEVHVMPQGNRTDVESYFNQIRVWGTHPQIISLKDSTTRYTLHLSGKQEVYGISLETKTGVIVDNIPMRGCAGTIFTGINAQQLTDYYRQTNTRLIILQYGGNVMPYTRTQADVDRFVESMRYQIRYLHRCAPNVAILMVGPSDMMTKINGRRQSYPMLRPMDETLDKMCNEEGVYYWSIYRGMGGNGTMVQWMDRGLAGSDGVHFTKKGADKAGELLWEYMSNTQQNDQTAD